MCWFKNDDYGTYDTRGRRKVYECQACGRRIGSDLNTKHGTTHGNTEITLYKDQTDELPKFAANSKDVIYVKKRYRKKHPEKCQKPMEIN